MKTRSAALAALLALPGAAAALPHDCFQPRSARGIAAAKRTPDLRISTAELLEEARKDFARLSAAGHYKTAAAFGEYRKPEYADKPGFAEYDHAPRSCRVTINAEAARARGIGSAVMLRFMIYHEIAHCHLFDNAHEISALPGAPEPVNRLVSDLVHTEYLTWGEGGRPNAYMTYHESYADSKAIALMLAEGWTVEELAEVTEMRSGGMMVPGDSHDTLEMLTGLYAAGWRGLGAGALEAEARAHADRHIVFRFLRKLYNPGELMKFTPSAFLKSNLGSTMGEIGMGAVMIGNYEPAEFLKKRIAEVADAPQDSWRAFAAAYRPGAKEDEVVGAFFRARYGAGPDELGPADAAAHQAITQTRK